MTFIEAMKQVEKGVVVRREDWPEGVEVYRSFATCTASIGHVGYDLALSELVVNFCDLNATDWEVIR